MFGGREEAVGLKFENRLVGVVIDHFGQSTMIIGKDENHFSIKVRVNVSGQFFGWLAGLGQVWRSYPLRMYVVSTETI